MPIQITLTDLQRRAILRPFLDEFGEDYENLARVLMSLEIGIRDILGVEMDWRGSLMSEATLKFNGTGLSVNWWVSEIERMAITRRAASGR